MLHFDFMHEKTILLKINLLESCRGDFSQFEIAFFNAMGESLSIHKLAQIFRQFRFYSFVWLPNLIFASIKD